MSVLHEERQLSAEHRRALKLLADAGEHGCTGVNSFNHGFSVGLFADLVSHGLATGHREIVRVGYRTIKVARIRITDAGRRALEEQAGRRDPVSIPRQSRGL
jgi:DNA-binding PadR family transcriptional regulator